MRPGALVIAAVVAGLLGSDGTLRARRSLEIPAFARRYGLSCNVCHNPIPKLTPFGETFAGNGFRMASAEPPRDTLATGDDLLLLMRDIPLSIRFDAYVSGATNGETATDFDLPYNLKLLSGGPISQKLSYYLYFFLFERGEVGGIEDAFLYVNDLVGDVIDLASDSSRSPTRCSSVSCGSSFRTTRSTAPASERSRLT